MTQWAETIAIKRVTVEEMERFVFESIFCLFFTPLELIFDQGPNFFKELVDNLLMRLKIKCRHFTPYYPQCIGLVEKVNGIHVSSLLNKWEVNPRTWTNT